MIRLSKHEQEEVLDRATENIDAYELYIRANEYFGRHTLEAYTHAKNLLSESLQLDPNYARAYHLKGFVLASICRSYGRESEMLSEAESLVHTSLRLRPDDYGAYTSLAFIYQLQGNTVEAERACRMCIEKAPDKPAGYFALGFFFQNSKEYSKAISPYEHAIRLEAMSLATFWNLVNVCLAANDSAKGAYWAATALSLFDRYLMLHPDDQNRRTQRAILLAHANLRIEAREAAVALMDNKDGVSLYNTACLWTLLNEPSMAVEAFRKCVEAGFNNPAAFQSFLEEEFAQYKDEPEYEMVADLVLKLKLNRSTA